MENDQSPEQLSLAKVRTKKLFSDLMELVKEEASKHELQLASKKTHEPPKPHKVKYRRVLQALVYFPWLMLVTFIASFFWDFDGIQRNIYSHTFYFEGLLRILSVSALIGYATNWVAIKMLFRPRKLRPILGHGLIPAQKERIAFRLAQAVSKDLINPSLIQQKIHESGLVQKYRKRISIYLQDFMASEAFRSGLKNAFKTYFDDLLSDPELRAVLARHIVQHLDAILEKKLMEKLALRVYTTVKGRDTQEVVEEALQNMPLLLDSGLERVDELLNELPTQVDAYADRLEAIFTEILFRLINQLDVHELVEGNLRRFDESKLEGLILGATNEQLHYIQYLGAFFGAIGGLVIWEPVIAGIGLTVLIGCILGLDRILGGPYPSGD